MAITGKISSCVVGFNAQIPRTSLAEYIVQGDKHILNSKDTVVQHQPDADFFKSWINLDSDIEDLVVDSAVPDFFSERLESNIGELLASGFRRQYSHYTTSSEIFDRYETMQNRDGMNMNSARFVLDRTLSILGLRDTVNHYRITETMKLEGMASFLEHFDKLLRYCLQGIYSQEFTEAKDRDAAVESVLILGSLYQDPNDLIGYSKPMLLRLLKIANEDFHSKFLSSSANDLAQLAAIKLINHIDFNTCPAEEKAGIERQIHALWFIEEDKPMFRTLALMALQNLQASGHELTCFNSANLVDSASDSDLSRAEKEFIRFLTNEEYTRRWNEKPQANHPKHLDYSAQLMKDGFKQMDSLRTEFKSGDARMTMPHIARMVKPYSYFYADHIERYENVLRRLRGEEPSGHDPTTMRHCAASLLSRRLGQLLGNYQGEIPQSNSIKNLLLTTLGEADDETFNKSIAGLTLIAESLMQASWSPRASLKDCEEQLERARAEERTAMAGSEKQQQVATKKRANMDKVTFRLASIVNILRQRHGGLVC